MIINRKGLSGIGITIDTAYHDTGRSAIIAGDGNLTSQIVVILGFILQHYVNTVAVELSDGRVTAIAPDKLRLT